jgi:hypothetical protein
MKYLAPRLRLQRNSHGLKVLTGALSVRTLQCVAGTNDEDALKNDGPWLFATYRLFSYHVC